MPRSGCMAPAARVGEWSAGSTDSSATVIATDQDKLVPLHDLYRFRRSGDAADVVYCCSEIHLTTSDRDVQERGTIVGCRYNKEGWLCWDGYVWKHANARISRRFEKLPVMGDVPH